MSRRRGDPGGDCFGLDPIDLKAIPFSQQDRRIDYLVSTCLCANARVLNSFVVRKNIFLETGISESTCAESGIFHLGNRTFTHRDHL